MSKLYEFWATKIYFNFAKVEMFVEDECFRSCVVNRHLSYVPDIDKIAGKFHRISAMMSSSKKGSKNPSSIASIEDLVRVYVKLI